MKFIFILGAMFYFQTALSAQKAKIANPTADIYSGADFDSEILDTVNAGETFIISDKVYGPFFRIKLKSGKIGYIPDTDVDIEGKGRIVPLSEDGNDEDPFLRDMEDAPKKDKNKKAKKAKPKDEDDPENEYMHGVSLQIINFHEDTLGSVQVDDLPAIGYRSITDFSWEVFASFKAPKYYSEKLRSTSARGFNVWGTFGLSSEIQFTSLLGARYGGGLMGHFSALNVETPTKNYDLQDATVGGYLEGAFLIKFAKLKTDFSIKYILDRQNYGAFGLTIFF